MRLFPLRKTELVLNGEKRNSHDVQSFFLNLVKILNFQSKPEKVVCMYTYLDVNIYKPYPC